MNKERKKQIKNEVIILNQIVASLNNILDQENDYYDNIPENLQTSIRADDSESAIDSLTDAIEDIEQAIGSLNSI